MGNRRRKLYINNSLTQSTHRYTSLTVTSQPPPDLLPQSSAELGPCHSPSCSAAIRLVPVVLAVLGYLLCEGYPSSGPALCCDLLSAHSSTSAWCPLTCPLTGGLFLTTHSKQPRSSPCNPDSTIFFFLAYPTTTWQTNLYYLCRYHYYFKISYFKIYVLNILP